MNMKIDLKGINGITRSQKILVSLFKVANGTNSQVRFEDIAVEAFKNFRSDFQLRGYPEYPDTGDIIHKPLYSELKKGGFINSGNKYFSLTPKGIEYARKILNMAERTDGSSGKAKLTASQQKELERIMQTTAFNLYTQGKKEQILDIDFYSFLGVTVRTNKFDFLGRLSTVEDAIGSAKTQSDSAYQVLAECFKYLCEKFKTNIDYVRHEKGGKR